MDRLIGKLTALFLIVLFVSVSGVFADALDDQVEKAITNTPVELFDRAHSILTMPNGKLSFFTAPAFENSICAFWHSPNRPDYKLLISPGNLKPLMQPCTVVELKLKNPLPKKVSVVSSSGNTEFDQAACFAVDSALATPFVVPSENVGGKLRFVFYPAENSTSVKITKTK